MIKSLGARVEQEHGQHLRDVRRIEDQTANVTNGLANGTNGFNSTTNGVNGEMDFESLVKGQSTGNVFASPVVTDPWSADGWGDNDIDSNLVSTVSLCGLLYSHP